MANRDFFWIDLHYKNEPRLIATGVLPTEDGLLLIDPGPDRALEGLQRGLQRRGFNLDDVSALLLTHIHLDHAGATGTIVARHPAVEVVVHRIGAPHVANPSRLLRSARRIYGDEMDELWGEVAPVPEENITVVRGGETLTRAGRSLEVAYTPGHASHHVSFLDQHTGIAFVGDVAGMRIAEAGYIIPVAPPPDVDVERWFESIETVAAWEPDQLFLTHCGLSSAPAEHLHRVRRGLKEWSDEVATAISKDYEQARNDFVDKRLTDIHEAVPSRFHRAYEVFGDPGGSWDGLARYWKRQVDTVR